VLGYLFFSYKLPNQKFFFSHSIERKASKAPKNRFSKRTHFSGVSASLHFGSSPKEVWEE
jgi:hypothetical protein